MVTISTISSIDDTEIMEIIDEYAEKTVANLQRLNLPNTLEAFASEIQQRRQFIIEKLKSMHNSIQWMVDNPGTQLTSSVNPIFEDEWKWYGTNFYVPTGHIRRETIIGSFLGHQKMIDRLLLFYSIERRSIGYHSKAKGNENNQSLEKKKMPKRGGSSNRVILPPLDDDQEDDYDREDD
jgi:hypothetical protein